VLFDFGLSDANQPMMGSVGTDQPEIYPQSFGMLSQLQTPPVINSKGVVQPQGTEQMQKETNLFQDRLSLGTDNMLAAIAGQFAPTAFEPTYKPQGNPVTATGLRQLQSLANTGGWEGFMASQMLPVEYGGAGMSSSQAKGALLKALKVPDNADEQALAQREELRSSLTPRYETQGESTNPSVKPINKDLSTDQGIVNSFDFSDVDQVSRQWQSDLAKDPVIGYTDPQTGLSYTGALAEKTPTMEWFDKYGLPYANKRYDDPDEIRRMQDAVAPVAPGQLEAEDLQNQQALAANAKARGELGQAQSQDELLRNAYNKIIKAPTGVDAAQRPNAPGKFLMDINASGTPVRLSSDQNIPWGASAHKTDMGAGMKGMTRFDFGKPGATLPPSANPLEALGLNPLVQPDHRRVMTADDLAPAAQRVAMAKRAAAATVPGIQRASQSSPSAFARQMAQARLIGLSLAGRTPLNDTLNGRMMAARAAGVYG
jgi:hypothetical protein